MTVVKRFVFVCALALSIPIANATPPPLEMFANLEETKDAAISPDGRYLAVISVVDGRRVALARNLSDGGNLIPVMWTEAGSDFTLTWCRWANSNRLLCGLTGTAQFQQWTYASYKLAAVDADGKNLKELMPGAAFRNSEFDERLFDRLPQDPQKVLVRAAFNQPRGPEEPIYLYTLDIYTGKSVQVMTTFRNRIWNLYSNGVGNLTLADGPGDHGNGSYTDSAGNSRILRGHAGELSLFAGRDDGKTWERLSKASAFSKTNPMTPLAVNAADGHAYGYALSNGRMALWEFDLEDKDPPMLDFEHAQADVRDVTTDGMGRLMGVYYDTDRPHVQYIDDQLGAIMRGVNKALPNTFNYVRSMSADHKMLVIAARSDVEAGRFYLFDAKSSKLTSIGAAYPQLDAQQLARMRSIEYPAQDGKMIPGYLTTPPNLRAEKLPLIVMPHSGYQGRSYWAYDMLSQFLTTRGYAVISMNYRGSSGYGKEWREAAQQDWSGLIYSDITDAARWAIAQGIADPARVCILGSGYSGYAALLGAIRNPDIYRCAASVSGHVDLLDFADYQKRASGQSQPAMAETNIDKKLLKKTDSPLRHVDDINVPVLLIHGTHDTRAPFEQTENMAKALERAGKKYKFVKLEKADYSLQRASERATMLKEVEEFLADAIGKP